ncbi:hypothetical protein SLEP1_g56631 [Rubroshorea leprosula]|uniref:Uncharacterized protein n=1 Tax=Rubroshorea leprosula TaxID=152421 RepID=A0AAV5MM17_9ROSI|nr:hypothetical protein SLEP1_g56631 [Rubroshorea leprosula]
MRDPTACIQKPINNAAHVLTSNLLYQFLFICFITGIWIVCFLRVLNIASVHNHPPLSSPPSPPSSPSPSPSSTPFCSCSHHPTSILAITSTRKDSHCLLHSFFLAQLRLSWGWVCGRCRPGRLLPDPNMTVFFLDLHCRIRLLQRFPSSSSA